MIRILLLSVALLVTNACGEADTTKAERAYNMVKSTTIDADEICAAARRVAQAWLDAGDAERYRTAAMKRDLDCQTAYFSHQRP